jgi:hypothetical protein
MKETTDKERQRELEAMIDRKDGRQRDGKENRERMKIDRPEERQRIGR